MDPLDSLRTVTDAAAFRLASEIATHFGSKPKKNRVVRIGEPFCPYKVACHQDAFQFFVLISDKTYNFTARHQRETKEIRQAAEFCISLKTPVAHMGTRQRLEEVSQAAGIEVYTQIWTPAGEVIPQLLVPPVLKALKQLDYTTLSYVLLSQLQMHASGRLTSADECIQQIRRLQELFTVVFKTAWDKHHPSPPL